MANNFMEINNKFEIYTRENGIAKSIVQEVIDEETIAIAVPVLNGLNYVLENGESVVCNYYDGKGNIYSFDGFVSGRKVEKIPLIIIKAKTELRKIQRRDYVRIPVLIDIKYTVEIVEEAYKTRDIEKYQYKSGKAVDLSGGGMKIVVAEKLDIGQDILIKAIVGSNFILAICEVVRIETESVKINNYTYAVKFKYIDSKSREEVIRYIFENMRKSIKTK